MKKCGFSIHCHHDVLVEYCTDYKKRLDYIKSEKPNDERAIRLKCFKLLPRRALKDLPENLLKAYDDRQKAYDDWRKAYDDWRKAYDDWRKAYDDWPLESKNSFHKKWCRCSHWDGKKLVFLLTK